MQEISTGIYGSLLVFPLNLVVVYIFRNSKHRESASLRAAKKKASGYEKSHEKSLADLHNVKPPTKKKKGCCDGYDKFLFISTVEFHWL